MKLHTRKKTAGTAFTKLLGMLSIGFVLFGISIHSNAANNPNIGLISTINPTNSIRTCLGIVGTAAANSVVTTVDCDSKAPIWSQMPDGRIAYGNYNKSPSFCL